MASLCSSTAAWLLVVSVGTSVGIAVLVACQRVLRFELCCKRMIFTSFQPSDLVVSRL